VQSNSKINIWQQLEQQFVQRFNVLGTVCEDLLALLAVNGQPFMIRSRIASLRLGAMLLSPKYCKAPIKPWFFLGIPLPLTWHLNSGLRSKIFLGIGQLSAKWHAISALATKQTTSVSGPIS